MKDSYLRNRCPNILIFTLINRVTEPVTFESPVGSPRWKRSRAESGSARRVDFERVSQRRVTRTRPPIPLSLSLSLSSLCFLSWDDERELPGRETYWRQSFSLFPVPPASLGPGGRGIFIARWKRRNLH